MCSKHLAAQWIAIFLVLLAIDLVRGQALDWSSELRKQGEIVVCVQPKITKAQLSKVLRHLSPDASIEREMEHPELFLIKSDDKRVFELIARLQSHPYVATASANWLWTTERVDYNDPDLANNARNWGLRAIQAPKAWEIMKGGAAVGVVDSGVAIDHEDLKSNLNSPYSYSTKSREMQTGDKRVRYQRPDGTIFYEMERVEGHGTHVAGTIGAVEDNGVGTVGVSPDSKIIPVQALYYYPELEKISGSAEEINNGIIRAIDSGAKVVNLSIGNRLPKDVEESWIEAVQKGDQATIDSLRSEIRKWNEEFVARNYWRALDLAINENVILIKAAGNESYLAEFDPLCISGRTINVAAVDSRLDADDQPVSIWRTGFSNYGDLAHVSAPGIRIWSTYSEGNEYKSLQGTSMSAPHVTGAVALMKAMYPDVNMVEARDILIKTGFKVDPIHEVGPMINVHAALVELTQSREGGGTPSPPPPNLIPAPPTPPDSPELPPTWEEIINGPEPWNNPEVQRLIDLWLSVAYPKSSPPLGKEYAPWYYDQWGRMLNPWFTAKIPPDWAPYKYKFLWERSRKYDSEQHLTMYEFVVGRLRDGAFTPTPPPITPPADRNPEFGSQPIKGEVPAEQQWLGGWKGKNKNGDVLTITFRRDWTADLVHPEKSGVFEAVIRKQGNNHTGELHHSIINISVERIGFRFSMSDVDTMRLRTDLDEKIPIEIGDGDSVYELKRVAKPGNGPDFPAPVPPVVPGRIEAFPAHMRVLEAKGIGNEETLLGISFQDPRWLSRKASIGTKYTLPIGYDVLNYSISGSGKYLWAIVAKSKYYQDEDAERFYLMRMDTDTEGALWQIPLQLPDECWTPEITSSVDGEKAWIAAGIGNFRVGFGRIFYHVVAGGAPTNIVDTREAIKKQFGANSLGTIYPTSSPDGEKAFCLTGNGIVSIGKDATCNLIVSSKEMQFDPSAKTLKPVSIEMAGEGPNWTALYTSGDYAVTSGVGSRIVRKYKIADRKTAHGSTSFAGRFAAADPDAGGLRIWDAQGNTKLLDAKTNLKGQKCFPEAVRLSGNGKMALFRYNQLRSSLMGLYDLETGVALGLPGNPWSKASFSFQNTKVNESGNLVFFRGGLSGAIGYNPTGVFRYQVGKNEDGFPTVPKLGVGTIDGKTLMIRAAVYSPGGVKGVYAKILYDRVSNADEILKNEENPFYYQGLKTLSLVKDQANIYETGVNFNPALIKDLDRWTVRVMVTNKENNRTSCFDYSLGDMTLSQLQPEPGQ